VGVIDTLVGLEAMSRYLRANGLKNRIDEGAIHLSAHRVKRISMRVGGHVWFPGGRTRLRVGPIPIYASQALPVQVTYAFDIDPAKAPESFDAKLKWERDGFLGLGEIRRAWFEGGERCTRLNAQPRQLLALARCMRRFERLRLVPDVAAAEVKAVHQQKMRVRFSLLSTEWVDVERFLPPVTFFESLDWLGGALARLKVRRAAARTRRSPRGL
jgi:hypothetical protein